MKWRRRLQAVLWIFKHCYPWRFQAWIASIDWNYCNELVASVFSIDSVRYSKREPIKFKELKIHQMAANSHLNLALRWLISENRPSKEECLGTTNSGFLSQNIEGTPSSRNESGYYAIEARLNHEIGQLWYQTFKLICSERSEERSEDSLSRVHLDTRLHLIWASLLRYSGRYNLVTFSSLTLALPNQS